MMSRSGMRWPAVAGRETRQNTMYVGVEEVHVRPRQVGQPSRIIVDYHTPAVSYCEKVASKWAAKCLLQCVGGVGDTLIAGWWLDTHAVTHSDTYICTYVHVRTNSEYPIRQCAARCPLDSLHHTVDTHALPDICTTKCTCTTHTSTYIATYI